MYCDFFQLQLLPFNNTPDPRFFFNTPDHEEALASLVYAAQERKGFVLVTGEVGSGKTLLSRLLLSSLGHAARTAVINNTRLSGAELVSAVCREFGVELDDDATPAETSRALEQFLLEQYSRDRLAVLVLDEAQNLPIESFEELRMLGNLEADDAKLLQVLILGQPELQDSFRLPSMRQLHQRVFRTFHLGALSRELTEGYIKHRLAVAGLPAGQDVFDDDAIEAIYRHSDGIPRLINQVCDNSMLAAYTDSDRRITARLVNEVVQQMMSLPRGPGERKPKSAFARQMLGAAARPEAAASTSAEAQASRGYPPSQGMPPSQAGSPAQGASQSHAAPQAQLVQAVDARVPYDFLSDRLREIDSVVRRMADRLDSSEKSLSEIQRQGTASAEKPAAPSAELEETRRLRAQVAGMMAEVKASSRAAAMHMRRLLENARASSIQRTPEKAPEKPPEPPRPSPELEEVRRLREQVDGALNELKSTSREAHEQVRGMLEEARNTAASLETQAARSFDAAERHGAVAQVQTEHMLQQVRAFAQGEQKRIEEAMSRDQAALQAAQQARKKAAKLADETLRVSKQSQDGTRTALNEARQAAEGLEQLAVQAMGTTEEQNAALRKLVQQLVEQLSGGGDANGALLAELAMLHQAEIEATRQRVDVLVNELRDRDKEFSRQSVETATFVRSQIKSVSDRLDHLPLEATARADSLNETMLKFLEEAKSRGEISYQQLVDVVTVALREMQRTRKALHETQERMATEGSSVGSQTTSLLEETRDLLTRTREQAASLLANLRSQVTEQAERADQLWQTALSQGARTLYELDAKLAEARIRADHARGDLETTAQMAINELANTRGAFESGLEAHKSEIARLATDARTAKDKIAAEFSELRKEMEDVSAKQQTELRGKVERLIEESVASADARLQETMQKLDEHKRGFTKVAEEAVAVTAAVSTRFEEARQSLDESATRQQEALKQRVDAMVQECERSVDHAVEEATKRLDAHRSELEALGEQTAAATLEIARRLEKVRGDLETASTSEQETLRQQLAHQQAEFAKLSEQATQTAETIAARFAHARDELQASAGTQLETVRHRLAQLVQESTAASEERITEAVQRLNANKLALAKLSDQTAAVVADVTKRFSEARGSIESTVEKQHESLRENLAVLVNEAVAAAQAQTQQAAESLKSNKAEIARLANDAAVIRLDVSRRFDELKNDLEMTAAKHQEGLRQRVGKLIEETEQIVSTAEDKGKETTDRLGHELGQASQRAQTIYTELQQSLSLLEENSGRTQSHCQQEFDRVQQSFADLVSQNRSALQQVQAQVDGLSQQATQTSEALNTKLAELRQAAQAGVRSIGMELDECLDRAMQKASQIGENCDAVASSLADRMQTTQREAQNTIAGAERVISELEERSRGALADVRSGLSQMVKRSEHVQKDLVQLRDDVGQTAKAAEQHMHETAAAIVEQIEALRKAAHRDAEANQQRLAALRQQVEQGAEQVRQNSTKLLNQVEAGTQSLRDHANELLKQAQDGADRIGERAAAMLEQAHMAADRFREQAEGLLRRTETSATAVNKEIQTVRTELSRQADALKEQVAGASSDLAETRQETALRFQQASEVHAEAQRRTDDLLKQADKVKAQSESLLNMPRRLVEEANQQAASLADLSKKVTAIVQQLAAAGDKAQRNKTDLDQANGSAAETVDLLKRHTARVGQLVGIIRQLYGTMDARIDRLRNRLAQADELCRTVPTEIDSLRTALSTETEESINARSRLMNDETDRTPPAPTSASKLAATLEAKTPKTIGRSGGKRPPLGDLVRNSQKLNKWLRDVLKDAEQPEQQQPAAAPTQASQRNKQPTPV